MNTQSVNSQWTMMVQSARSHTDAMMRMMRYPRAAKLTQAQLDKFANQSVPDTEEQLSVRQMQQLALSSFVGAISHADSMAKMSPAVAEAIFDQTEVYCGRELPTTLDEMQELQMASIALSGSISSLSHRSSMAKLNGSFKDTPEFDEVVRLGREARNVL